MHTPAESSTNESSEIKIKNIIAVIYSIFTLDRSYLCKSYLCDLGLIFCVCQLFQPRQDSSCSFTITPHKTEWNTCLITVIHWLNIKTTNLVKDRV